MKTIGTASAVAAEGAVLLSAGCRHPSPSSHQDPGHVSNTPVKAVHDEPTNFDPTAVALLEELRVRGAAYFIEQADPATGIVLDRAPADGGPRNSGNISGSIAATGFGLSSLCVAAEHHYLPPSLCEQRILLTLSFLLNQTQHVRGFFPHYLDLKTGVAISDSEFSSIDTALLLAGALHARQFLNSAKADELVSAIYERVEWPWMLSGQHLPRDTPKSLSMGWLPGAGLLSARWDSYSECLLMYLLAIGSPTHPLAPEVWDAIQRNTYDYGGIRFISSFGALFIHQYLHVWADVRGHSDGYTNYFQNSIAATRAHKAWCMLQHGRFSWVDERVWGFSACDTPHGVYSAWAAPPVVGEWDGTLSPHAAGGSLPLLPEESIVVLKAMRDHHPRCFRKYGFVNAFNPGASGGDGWFDPDVIASDLALILLMAENQQTGLVRASFMKNPEIHQAMQSVGFRRV